jgi:hypothetical protein
MTVVKRKVVRLVRMHVQQVTDPIQVEAKDWNPILPPDVPRPKELGLTL